MNIYFLAAGSCAALLLLWQLTIGRKQVLVPLKIASLTPWLKPYCNAAIIISR